MVDCNGCTQVSLVGDEYCRSCGFELPDEEVITCDCDAIVADADNFCHDCGQELSDHNECASCGVQFKEDLDDCPGCGVSLLEEDDEDDDDVEYEDDDDTEDDDAGDESVPQPENLRPDVPTF